MFVRIAIYCSFYRNMSLVFTMAYKYTVWLLTVECSLNPSALPVAQKRLVRKDNVVEKVEAEYLGGGSQAGGDFVIFRGGGELAGGVVVGADDCA